MLTTIIHYTLDPMMCNGLRIKFDQGLWVQIPAQYLNPLYDLLSVINLLWHDKIYISNKLIPIGDTTEFFKNGT